MSSLPVLSDPPAVAIRWSFSALKNFKGCRRRYYHEKVVGDAVQEPNEATNYGSLFHEAAENYLTRGTPVPPEFAYSVPLLDSLKAAPGELFSELDISLRADYSPCTAEDPFVWYKGFADVVILDREKKRAMVGDFKTGNSAYADLDQLEIYALAIFRHFPEIETVRGMLLFTKPGKEKAISKTFTKAESESKWLKWIADLDQIRRARDLNAWPASPSGLCKFCPVKHCMEHPSWKF